MSQQPTDLQPELTPWPEPLADAYRQAGYWLGEPLGELLRHSADHHPDRTALIEGERRCTYAELDRRANALAAGLSQLGLGAGDKVVVQLPNRIELVQLLFALFRLGVAPVLALPAHRQFEITYFCRHSAAKAYFTVDTFAGFDYRALARKLRKNTDLSLSHTVILGGAQEFTPLADLYREPDELPTPVDASRLALLQLSGGTTSVPKLIPRTHDDYFYSVRASADICGLNTDSIYLAALPVVHNFPLSSPGLLGTLYAGGTVVLAPNGAPGTALDLIEFHRVTLTALVPPLALAWMQALQQQPRNLDSLKLLQVGGAKLSAEAARQLTAAFPATLQQVFGMAEGLVNYTRLDDPESVILHTQGRPISPHDEIRVVDEADRDLPPGELGQLLTRGPYTIRGYYRAEAQNAKSFTPEGFYRTGDLVRLTEDGYLMVEGRAKDQINRGGEKVSAEEVEDQLLAHPMVHDVAMVAMPDAYLGERNCAFVIPSSNDKAGHTLTLPALRQYLRERGLAEYKLPDRLELVSAFPTTSFGKVSKQALRERLAAPCTEPLNPAI